MSPFTNKLRRRPHQIGPDVKLSLAVGVVCLFVGGVASLANLIAPETTLLDGLWAVALFYLALGASGVARARWWQGCEVVSARRPAAEDVRRRTGRRARRNPSVAA